MAIQLGRPQTFARILYLLCKREGTEATRASYNSDRFIHAFHEDSYAVFVDAFLGLISSARKDMHGAQCNLPPSHIQGTLYLC